MTDGQLLVPATQAAKKLGISRRTLKRHVGAGLVRSVTMGARTFVAQREINRLVSGESAPAQNETKPEAANQISGEVSNPDQACTNEDIPARFTCGGRFDWQGFSEWVAKTMYDGPRGALLREYHDALERWRVEFHKTDKDLAVVDALWAAVLPAYRAAFGKEASPEDVKSIRSLDVCEEDEKVWIRKGRILNRCITTNIRDDFDNPDAIAVKAAWDTLKSMPKGNGLGVPSSERQKAVEAYDAAWSKWQARRAGYAHF
jgi:hypothetical protein